MSDASTKAPGAFRTISEVAEELDLPQHVLRFWETRFNQIKPMKRGGGRRYYRPEDVDLLRGIRLLLYAEGYTIRGVQRLLKAKGVAFVVAAGQSGSVQTSTSAGFKTKPSIDVADEFAAEGGREGDEDEELAEDEPADAESDHAEDAETRPPGRLEPFLSAAPAQLAAGLGKDGRRKLESALSELLEAKRLLDQVR